MREPLPYFTLLFSLVPGASTGNKRHQIVTHTSQSKKYFGNNSWIASSGTRVIFPAEKKAGHVTQKLNLFKEYTFLDTFLSAA